MKRKENVKKRDNGSHKKIFAQNCAEKGRKTGFNSNIYIRYLIKIYEKLCGKLNGKKIS